jgi:hypothetical protein
LQGTLDDVGEELVTAGPQGEPVTLKTSARPPPLQTERPQTGERDLPAEVLDDALDRGFRHLATEALRDPPAELGAQATTEIGAGGHGYGGDEVPQQIGGQQHPWRRRTEPHDPPGEVEFDVWDGLKRGSSHATSRSASRPNVREVYGGSGPTCQMPW